jgi:hypothetical protein
MTPRLDADSIASIFEKHEPPPTSADQFSVLRTWSAGATVVHLAIGRQGVRALLVPVSEPPPGVVRMNHGVTLRSAPTTEFRAPTGAWTEAAAILECRDDRLMKSFAAMVSAVVARLATDKAPTWQAIVTLYAEWERLFGRRELLGSDSELGLWGELWVVSTSTRDLSDGWLGPDGESIDVVVDATGFEVKTGRRPDTHIISQSQIDAPLGAAPVFLVSIHVVPDPLRGCTLPELVRRAASKTANLAAFEEKLAGVGYSRDDDEVYVRRFAVAEQPRFYAAASVPRVLSADPGVSNLRYRVDLDPTAAATGEELDRLATILGIPITSLNYPCA